MRNGFRLWTKTNPVAEPRLLPFAIEVTSRLQTESGSIILFGVAMSSDVWTVVERFVQCGCRIASRGLEFFTFGPSLAPTLGRPEPVESLGEKRAVWFLAVALGHNNALAVHGLQPPPEHRPVMLGEDVGA